MNRYLQSALVAALGVASMTCAFAQDTTPPSTNSRESAAQAPAPRTTDPSTTTSPNRQAAAGTKESHKQMMKDCVAKEQANNTGVSAAQARKDCKAQMKSHGSEPKSY